MSNWSLTEWNNERLEAPAELAPHTCLDKFKLAFQELPSESESVSSSTPRFLLVYPRDLDVLFERHMYLEDR